MLAYGFVARVLTGPTLSPLGQLVTRVLTPRLPFAPKYVAGPPKRFAQGIGADSPSTAVILHFGFGLDDAAYVLIGLLIVAATLESVFAALPRLQGLRRPHAPRHRPRRRLRALQRHLGDTHVDIGDMTPPLDDRRW